MRVAVIGAGNGGCAAAVDLTLQGHEIRLYARSSERLTPFRDRGGIEATGAVSGFARPALMTTDLAEAVKGAEVIMFTVPLHAHETYGRAVAPLLAENQVVFLNPGHTGGALHLARVLRDAGYKGPLRILETVTLTYICRMEGPARIAVYSRTRALRAAVFPRKEHGVCWARVAALYPDLVPASSVLETAFLNINAILHPPGTLMNAGWVEYTSGGFRFYAEGITPSVARVMEALDAERMAVARALEVPTTTFLAHFHEAGLTSAQAVASGSIYRAAQESVPNQTIRAPVSLEHRYVVEDVAFGLVPMAAFGTLVEVATPVMNALIVLASAALGRDLAEEGLTLSRLGLEGRTEKALPEYLEEGP